MTAREAEKEERGMQHISIIANENDQPVANPGIGSVWRDDQGIMWQILDTRFAWDGANAVDFSGSDWVADGGVAPLPLGPAPETGPDQRIYAGMGPGSTTELKNYAYVINVLDLVTNEAVQVKRIKSVPPIDPDISNQPHP